MSEIDTKIDSFHVNFAMVSGDNGVERKATFIGQKKNQQNKTRKCCSVFFVAAADTRRQADGRASRTSGPK